MTAEPEEVALQVATRPVYLYFRPQREAQHLRLPSRTPDQPRGDRSAEVGNGTSRRGHGDPTVMGDVIGA